MSELVQAIAEAAVIEARTVAKLLEREGGLYWRATGGHMIPMTTHAAMDRQRQGVR